MSRPETIAFNLAKEMSRDRYLKHIFSFIGLRNVDALIIEGTTLPAEARKKLIAEQCERARAVGKAF